MRKRLLFSIGLTIITTMAIVLALVAACAKEVTPTTPTTTTPATTTTPTTTKPATTTAPAQTYTLTFAWNDVWGPEQQYGRGFRPGGEFQRQVFYASGGRLQLKMISQMFPSMELVAAVGTGKADMTDVPLPWYTGTYPLWSWSEVPGLLSTDPEQQAVEEMFLYEDPRYIAAIDKIYREDAGIVSLGIIQPCRSNPLFSNKKIATLADMQGLKIRVAGLIYGLTIKAMGAVTVTMAGSEVVPSLQSGLLDATLMPADYAWAVRGLHQVVKYMTIIPMSPAWQIPIVINAQKFDSLPPDLQEVLRQEAMSFARQTHLSSTDTFFYGLKGLKAGGVEMVKFEDYDAAVEAVKPVEGEWLKIAGPKGPELLALAKQILGEIRAFNAFPK